MKVLEDYLMYFSSESKKLFYNKWLRPVSSTELKTGAGLVHRCIEGAGAGVELWLLDASSCHTPCREDQEWIMDEIGKMATTPTCRLRKMALVRSGDVFFHVLAEAMQERLNALYGDSITMKHFGTLAAAYNWLLADERNVSSPPQNSPNTLFPMQN